MIHGGDVYSHKIKYDFSVNLNPLDCSEVRAEIMRRASNKLQHYPDPKQRAFREAVAEIEGVDPLQVWGGNGASEIFQALIFLIRPTCALIVEPCFSGYKHAMNSFEGGCIYVTSYELSKDQDFRITEDFVEFLKKNSEDLPAMIILANPNNPTGCTIDEKILQEVFTICKKHDVYVLMDECFLAMSNEGSSLSRYINEFEGLFIVNAFTKSFGIPGVRVGYLLSQEQNIKDIQKFLPEWNLSVIAQEAGPVCRDYIKQGWKEKSIRIIQEEREYLAKELQALGYKVFPSNTAFLLLYTERDLYNELLAKGVLIRDCSNYVGLEKGYYRIAVKNHEDNEALITILKGL